MGQKYLVLLVLKIVFLNQYIWAQMKPTVHIQDPIFSLGQMKTPILEVYHHISPYTKSLSKIIKLQYAVKISNNLENWPF